MSNSNNNFSLSDVRDAIIGLAMLLVVAILMEFLSNTGEPPETTPMDSYSVQKRRSEKIMQEAAKDQNEAWKNLQGFDVHEFYDLSLPRDVTVYCR